MTPHRIASGERLDQACVIEWRRRHLLAAGFAPALAAELAGGQDVDLLALFELTERGCPPELAVRILAPLDQAEPGTEDHGC